MRIDDRFTKANKFMKGAFYFECIWLTGPIPESQAFKPHSHDFIEYVGFLGSDPAEPSNLHAEIEFWFDDEKHIITRSCTVYVPEGVWHTPIIVPRLDRPVFCFSASPSTKYAQNVNRDPRWSHLPDPLEGK